MGDHRFIQRIPVTFHVKFSSTFFGTGEGIINDVTIQGGRIQTEVNVPWHCYLELRLHVSHADMPIVVDLAAVRWVLRGHVGVDFLSMRPEHQTRLQQIIEQVADLEETT